MVNVKRTWYVFFCLLLSGLYGCAYASMNATTLLENALNASDDITAYELIMETNSFTEHYFVADQHTQRLDYSDENGLFFSQMHVNGAIIEKDYERYELTKYENDEQHGMPTARESFLDEVEYLSTNAEIELLGEDTFLKREVYKLRFVDQETNKRKAELWVDKESFVFLKTIYITEENLEIVSEATYFKTNPTFEDDQFNLEEHLFTSINDTDIFESIGYEEIKAQFAGPLYLPSDLNEEWSFKEAKVSYELELAYVVATFVNSNKKEIQLFIQDAETFYDPQRNSDELIKVRGNDVSFVWEPSHHMANWQEGGLHYSLFTKRDWQKEEAIRFIEEMSFVKL
ncbi:hypothetical protein JCM19045_1318 [Bacillus sp. JCM 19045]|nr:hypothetical protein JCM19045_1318 [Bacillus sp. JCM 19045]